MACRIKNTGKHTLCLNLLGGETLYLKPGETSRAFREELLYHNPYLSDWLERGVAQWINAKMAEVIADEQAPPPQAAEPEKAGKAAAKPVAAKKKGKPSSGKD